MELIKNNPYRIVGVLPSDSERILQKQKAKIKAYARVSKKIESDYDFDILEDITRTEDVINKAFSNIEQNQDKVNYALFWFLNKTPMDNITIEYLKKGDKEKAFDILEKATLNKEINSKNFSAFNNLGTLQLLSPSDGEVKQGIEAKIKLMGSDYFKNFVYCVADETFIINHDKQVKILIDLLLTQLKNQYSNSEMLQLFSGCNQNCKKYLYKKFTQEPINTIESQIESTKNKRNKNKSNAYQYGLKLYKNCKDDLSYLKSLIGASDLKYKMLVDNLAKEIIQCSIDYFNERQDTEDPSKEALKLLNYAKLIAVGSQIKERISSNLKALDNYINKDSHTIIYILEQIQDAYKKPGYDFIGNRLTVNKQAVINMIKEKVTLQKVSNIARSNNSEIKQKFFDLIDYIFREIGENEYTYSIVDSFYNSLRSTDSDLKNKAKYLAATIKPYIPYEKINNITREQKQKLKEKVSNIYESLKSEDKISRYNNYKWLMMVSCIIIFFVLLKNCSS